MFESENDVVVVYLIPVGLKVVAPGRVMVARKTRVGLARKEKRKPVARTRREIETLVATSSYHFCALHITADLSVCI